MATTTITVIKLNAIQKAWVENENSTNSNKAMIIDYVDTSNIEHNDCLCSSVLTKTGYEDWATYFDGVTTTDIDINI